MLFDSGCDPSYLIGGVPVDFGSNYRLGSGDVFVVEGDEYDTAYFDKVPKFWHYPATYAAINNIEFDHADIYGSVEEIEAVFCRFAEQVSSSGSLWVNGQDKRALRAAGHTSARLSTFGMEPADRIHPTHARYGAHGTTFTLVRDGEEQGEFQSPLSGEHNLRNALGAIALCLDAGLSIDDVRTALARFRGILKRQQIIGTVRDIVVIDDFAHHPTAVRETLRAIRKRYEGRRLWALFEAKSNTSRRAVFQEDYPPAFESADLVVLSEVWKQDNLPEAEKISIPAVAESIRSRGKIVALIPAVDDIVAHVSANAAPGDVIAGLSGSSFGGIHQKLVTALEKRFGSD
jgi:UDP-N-acetylmuramate: L-alanyl-gamma-D-glutamyl-meso-diaminopimelate ligase